jgi:hypothetical protein
MELVELLAAYVHQEWMFTKLSAGIRSRLNADGREQMVPYKDLDDDLKELDRATVRAVFNALYAKGFTIAKRPEG